MAIIEDAGKILNGASELMKNPVVGATVSGMFGWLKSKLKGKSQERLEKIENNEHDERVIMAIEAQLEVILEDNEALMAEFEEKIEEVKKAIKSEGNNIGGDQNTIQVNGDGNIVLQSLGGARDINIST
jgi:hypothetical protein